MAVDLPQQLAGGFVEDQHLPRVGGVARLQLPQHGDHHVVGALVDEGDQGLLPVQQEVPLRVLLHGLFGNFPDEVPGEDIRNLIAQLLHEFPVDVGGLRGPHVGQGVLLPADHALRQELRHDLLPGGPVELQPAASQAVHRILHQLIQGHHHVVARQIGGDVVRIGDAHVRGRVGGNIGQHIPVDLVVVRIQPHGHGDVGIQRLEVGDGLLVDVRLGLVGVVLRPEHDLRGGGFIKALRDGKAFPAHLMMAGGKGEKAQHQGAQQRGFLFHPLVPPLETPAMIFFQKIRNSTISGTLITTTAAIMAGVFSRPKPLSRICWIPLETRK